MKNTNNRYDSEMKTDGVTVDMVPCKKLNTVLNPFGTRDAKFDIRFVYPFINTGGSGGTSVGEGDVKKYKIDDAERVD